MPGDLVLVPDPREPSRLLVKRVGEVHGDELFVVGDEAAASTDSRAFGPVAVSCGRGSALVPLLAPAALGRVR